MGFRRFLRRGQWDEERARELRSYLELETDDNIARGMTAQEAHEAARRKLGNVMRVREAIYDMNSVPVLDTLWQDLRYGARLLRRNPGFATVAILSLALGTGANTAVFQLVDAVRLRTLPVSNPEELVEIRIADSPRGRTGSFRGRRPMLTNPLWEQLRTQQDAFSGVLAWGNTTFDLATGGEVRPVQAVWVSGDFFSTLGIPAMLGRVFTSADDRRGCASPLAVVSHAFWQRQWGGDPHVVGGTVRLDGHAFEVIGVTPPSFFGVEVGRSFDVAVPICTEAMLAAASTVLDAPDVWFLGVMGRLKPGRSTASANAHLRALSEAMFRATLPPRYNADAAKDYLGFRLGAFPAGTGTSVLRTTYEAPLWVLLGVTGLVLMIACANLANLMLARATAREREVALRLAIGASRRRIVRQLLSESLLIAAIGTACGILVAQWFARLLVWFLSTEGNPLFVDLQLDWRIFVFTTALGVAACLLFGLAPALRVTSTSPGTAMKVGNRGATDSRERFGTRRVLVVVQVALSVVLVVGALLFVGSLRNLLTLDPGFRLHGVSVVSLDLERAGVPEGNRLAVYADIVNRLRALPDLEGVAEADIIPLSGNGWNEKLLIDGIPQPGATNFTSVGPGYFAVLGTPIVQGRDFDPHDTLSSPRVALVNQTFVRMHLKSGDPIGRVFQIEAPVGDPRPPYRIIGVVKDTKYADLREPFAPIAFLAAAQADRPSAFASLVIRSKNTSAALTAAVTQTISAINPSISLQFTTMTTQVQRLLVRERLMASLSGCFAALAALIAMIGLYGMMSYMVARRRTEIGIRMALGADRGAVVRLIVLEAGMLVVTGLLVGVPLAVAAANTARALLFGLAPSDPSTLSLAVLALGTVGAIASWLPAYRASWLEPTAALRQE